jgi:hypothetical protein
MDFKSITLHNDGGSAANVTSASYDALDSAGKPVVRAGMLVKDAKPLKPNDDPKPSVDEPASAKGVTKIVLKVTAAGGNPTPFTIEQSDKSEIETADISFAGVNGAKNCVLVVNKLTPAVKPTATAARAHPQPPKPFSKLALQDDSGSGTPVTNARSRAYSGQNRTGMLWFDDLLVDAQAPGNPPPPVALLNPGDSTETVDHLGRAKIVRSVYFEMGVPGSSTRGLVIQHGLSDSLIVIQVRFMGVNGGGLFMASVTVTWFDETANLFVTDPSYLAYF